MTMPASGHPCEPTALGRRRYVALVRTHRVDLECWVRALGENLGKLLGNVMLLAKIHEKTFDQFHPDLLVPDGLASQGVSR
jgi:hypothetical protein